MYFFVENVSSMDKSAAEEISECQGVTPYKVQCADAVRISGVQVVRKEGYWELVARAPFPLLHQWIGEDRDWPGH